MKLKIFFMFEGFFECQKQNIAIVTFDPKKARGVNLTKCIF